MKDNLLQRQELIQQRCLHPAGSFVPFPRADIDGSIVARFEQQVRVHAGKLAVRTAVATYTYTQLNAAANRLARQIRRQEADSKAPVLLLLEHGAAPIIAIFAVLKAGRPYVALDPAFPAQRSRDILADSGAALCLTNDANWETARELSADTIPLLNIDRVDPQLPTDDLNLPIAADDIAYIIYTSGSTGKPKGVFQSHRNLLHNIMQYTNTLHLSPHDRFSLLYSFSVNGSLRDIFGALLIGASVHTFDVKRYGLADLADWLIAEQITFYHSVPTVFRHFIDTLTGEEQFPHIRLIRFGGERVPAKYIDWYKRYFSDDCILYAGMGATETSTTRQCFIDKETIIVDPVVPTGFAVDERPILLLDDDGNPVPPGEVGTIAVQSRYLALGYWRKPELTAQVFRPDPQGGDARLYITGDLGRILDDGRLIHMGRKDAQVKVRGHRVELAELEQALLTHPQIKEAAAAAHPDGQGDQFLAGYVVLGSAGLTAADLHPYLKTKLPDYMIPQQILFMEKLPLTPNGKVARRELPVPDRRRPLLGSPYVPPQTAVQQDLAEIWAETLNFSPVGIHDDFFACGGHSLSAVRVIARLRKRLGVELPLPALFSAPTIAALAPLVAAQNETGAPPLQALPRTPDTVQKFPASFSQQRLWFLDQLAEGDTSFYQSLVLEIDGDLQPAILHSALQELAARHEDLRTTFVQEEDAVLQIVAPTTVLPFDQVDLRDRPAATRRDTAVSEIRQRTLQPYDLAAGPLARATLFRLDEQKHLFLLAMHHIITDGWSMAVLRRELMSLYADRAAGRPSALSSLPFQYADYAVWQKNWLESAAAAAEIAALRERLPETLPRLELPADFPRTGQSDQQGATLRFTLPASLTAALNDLSRGQGVTLNMTMLAAFKALLFRYTGQEDLLIGGSVSSRTRTEIEGLIGFFVNTLLLHTDLGGNPSFVELLGRVRETALAAYSHQDVPVEQVLAGRRDLSAAGEAPFSVLYIFQNTPGAAQTPPGLQVERIRVDAPVAKFDLTLTLTEKDAGLECAFEYPTGLFTVARITRMFAHLQTLLEQVVRDPVQTVAELPLLPGDEEAQIAAWLTAPADSPPFATMDRWLAAQAAEKGEKTAVIDGDRRLTYGELNGRANQLAHYLRTQGIGPDSIVGLHLPRSLEMIVGLLGILKAGGAYLPLDPTYPAARLALMLEDAQPQLVLTDRALPAETAVPTLHIIDDWPRIAAQPATNPDWTVSRDDLAYVIYTSGSTGRPKGVQITQRNLVHFVHGAIAAYGFRADDRMLQFATIAFDTAVEEIFPTFACGATLVLRTDEALDALDGFLDWCAEHQITVLDFPTAFWHQLVRVMDEEQLTLPPQVRLVIVGGEKADMGLLRTWQRLVPADVQLMNGYGPTETTVVASVYAVPTPAVETVSNGVLIGRPLPGVSLHLRDQALRPVPLGVPGELLVGGPTAARGYLRRPEQTAAAFIDDPRGGGRLYRTGDLVRLLDDGNLEFVGRVDEQVKIRGYRIELGEIEAVLSAYPGAAQVVVTSFEPAPAQRELAAYIVGRDGFDSAELRRHCLQTLPDYMVPASFTILDDFPLLPNGKVDRKRLPQPQMTRERATAVYESPQNDVERVIAMIWAEVLGIADVGATDNFFELGGHSLLGTQLITRIRRQLQVAIPLRALFARPTVRGLSETAVAPPQDGARVRKMAKIVLMMAQMSDEQVRQMLAARQ